MLFSKWGSRAWIGRVTIMQVMLGIGGFGPADSAKLGRVTAEGPCWAATSLW
jgi:hypothetical protein